MVRPWGTLLDLEVGLSCFEHKRKAGFANTRSPGIYLKHLINCFFVLQISDRYNLCKWLPWGWCSGTTHLKAVIWVSTMLTFNINNRKVSYSFTYWKLCQFFVFPTRPSCSQSNCSTFPGNTHVHCFVAMLLWNPSTPIMAELYDILIINSNLLITQRNALFLANFPTQSSQLNWGSCPTFKFICSHFYCAYT